MGIRHSGTYIEVPPRGMSWIGVVSIYLQKVNSSGTTVKLQNKHLVDGIKSSFRYKSELNLMFFFCI